MAVSFLTPGLCPALHRPYEAALESLTLPLGREFTERALGAPGSWRAARAAASWAARRAAKPVPVGLCSDVEEVRRRVETAGGRLPPPCGEGSGFGSPSESAEGARSSAAAAEAEPAAKGPHELGRSAASASLARWELLPPRPSRSACGCPLLLEGEVWGEGEVEAWRYLEALKPWEAPTVREVAGAGPAEERMSMGGPLRAGWTSPWSLDLWPERSAEESGWWCPFELLLVRARPAVLA